MKLRRTNKTDDWLTPPEIWSSLGPFDLDPCASNRAQTMIAATNYKLPEVNGLLHPWFGRVWCNPPYSCISTWTRRFLLHGDGIMIRPFAPETDSFWSIWKHADAVFMFKGRVRFIGPNGNEVLGTMFPSALVACGAANVQAIRQSGLKGTLVTSRELLPAKRNLLTSPSLELESNHGHKILDRGAE